MFSIFNSGLGLPCQIFEIWLTVVQFEPDIETLYLGDPVDTITGLPQTFGMYCGKEITEQTYKAIRYHWGHIATQNPATALGHGGDPCSPRSSLCLDADTCGRYTNR